MSGGKASMHHTLRTRGRASFAKHVITTRVKLSIEESIIRCPRWSKKSFNFFGKRPLGRDGKGREDGERKREEEKRRLTSLLKCSLSLRSFTSVALVKEEPDDGPPQPPRPPPPPPLLPSALAGGAGKPAGLTGSVGWKSSMTMSLGWNSDELTRNTDDM